MIGKEEALRILEQNIRNEKLRKHCILVSLLMKCLAKELGENQQEWEIVGLLHDIDYEKTKDNPKAHASIAAEMLDGKLDEKSLYAIRAHNFENTGAEPRSKMDFALLVADALSGLVIAAMLMMPNKTIGEIRLDTLAKKFKQKDFARNVSRENIMLCEKLGISKEKLFETALSSLTGFSL